MDEVTIVGGGLAGSEAALQLAGRGIPVRLLEMRPHTATGAHKTADLAEVVCSNSFKSNLLETASGILKAEMDVLGSRLLPVARAASVPAGHALGIDRELFAREVTATVDADPLITVERREAQDLNIPGVVVIATGPLTGSGLANALRDHFSSDHLYFYDSIAPSLDADTIDKDVCYWGGRYEKGGADYLNVPLDRTDYEHLLDYIAAAEKVQSHEFEEEKYFEACLPIEVMAARGPETLRYGPLKPRGLPDPRTGREPYAVIQLRQETRSGSLMGMVGFQTRMTFAAQKELIRSLPGLANVRVLRYGTIHRNIFINTPTVCTPYLRDRVRPDLYFAGQICGVEGYVESMASAIVVSLAITSAMQGTAMPALPTTTMLGALMEYVHGATASFQPMNANMGIVSYEGKRGRRNRRERNEAIARIALAAMSGWREDNSNLFEYRP